MSAEVRQIVFSLVLAKLGTSRSFPAVIVAELLTARPNVCEPVK